MEKPIRVMLCDDSSTMRRLIRKSIESDPRIKVVAEARNGKECVEQLPIAKPEALVLDVEMPVLGGIETVKAIRGNKQTLPIIMFSALTSRGAEATFDAIQAGANSFATKPTSTGHIEGAIKEVKNSLIPLIISLSRKPSVKRTSVVVSKKSVAAPQKGIVATKQSNPIQVVDARETPKLDKPVKDIVTSANRKPIKHPVAKAIKKIASDAPEVSSSNNTRGPSVTDIIAVGVSTGGPDALEKVLSSVPKGFSIPILITQHMPAVFTTMLAQRLSQKTGHKVIEAKNGQTVRPCEILIAPGDFHMTLERKGTAVTTLLTQDPPENSCRPAVDPMFRSVASLYGQRALGIVLTGMGRDGTEGARALKAAGALVYVQDEATSVVWGMPGKTYEAGLADIVLPINEIGHAIARCSSRVISAKAISKVGSK